MIVECIHIYFYSISTQATKCRFPLHSFLPSSVTTTYLATPPTLVSYPQPPTLSLFFLSALSLLCSSNYTLKVTLWICATCYHTGCTSRKLSSTSSVTLHLCLFNLSSPMESHQYERVQCKQTASTFFCIVSSTAKGLNSTYCKQIGSELHRIKVASLLSLASLSFW